MIDLTLTGKKVYLLWSATTPIGIVSDEDLATAWGEANPKYYTVQELIIDGKKDRIANLICDERIRLAEIRGISKQKTNVRTVQE